MTEEQIAALIAREKEAMGIRKTAEQQHQEAKEAKAKAEQKAAQEARDAHAAAQEATLKAEARRAFVGSDAAFAEAWPAMRQQIALQRMEAQKQADFRKHTKGF